MFSRRKKKLATDIAAAIGVEVPVVPKVLTELANQAYASGKSGFALPGFGKFRLVSGTDAVGTDPFTRIRTVFHAPPQVEFTLDTSAKKGFLAGREEPSETTGTVGTRTLKEIALTPKPDDVAAAGIDNPRSCKLKVGGEPDWLQAPETPVCCGDTMVFYGQFDSLDNQNYCIGDMGRLYVFFCQSCCAARSVLQF